jgi:hypothetical protein
MSETPFAYITVIFFSCYTARDRGDACMPESRIFVRLDLPIAGLLLQGPGDRDSPAIPECYTPLCKPFTVLDYDIPRRDIYLP